MRLAKLRIQKFGHFEDRTVNLGPGFTVVYGRNEAGKSTLLDAVAGFLWGIPARNPRTRTYSARSATLTGSVEHYGITVEHRRRLAKLTCDGGEVSAPWGAAGAEAAETWRTSFGLDHKRLREGGAKVLAGGGDLADLITLAETGESISELIGVLTKRAEELFKDRKNAGCEIRTAIEAIDAAERDLNEKEASAGEVSRLRGLIDGLEQRLGEVNASRTELRRREGGLEELQRCYRPGMDLAARQEQRAALGTADGFLDVEDTESLALAIADHEAQAATIQQLQEELAQAESRREGLSLNQAILDADATIAELQRQVEARAEDRATAEDQGPAEALSAGISDILIRLGRPDGNPSADSASLGLIADAVRQQLGRRAGAVIDFAGRVTQLRQRVAEVQEQASAEDEQDQDEGARKVAHARDRRSGVWARIRVPWLSGELPEAPERQALAQEFEQAERDADEIGELQIEAIKRLGEARGTRRERERILDRDRSELAENERLLAQSERAWRELADLHGLPAGLDAVGWELHDALLGQLAARLQDLRDLHRARCAARARWEAFEGAAKSLAPLVEGAPADPLPLIDALDGARRDAIEARTADRELAGRIAGLTDRLDAARARLAEAGERIARLTSGFPDGPGALVERSRLVHAADAALISARASLSTTKRPESDLDELRLRIAASDPIEISAEADRVSAEIFEAESEHQELLEALGGYRRDLRQLESRESTAQLLADLHAHGGRLRSLLDEYQGLRVQLAILQEYKQRLADAGDSPLLTQAAQYLEALTLGRYGGFTVVQDEAGRRIEVTLHDPSRPGDPEQVKVGELSEGTADQVFLALRLAGIGVRQAQRTAAGLAQVPVVLDDVLITSDDERSRAALALLGRLGEWMQIILLTHHLRVLDAADGLDQVATCTLAEVGAGDRVPLGR